MPALQRVQAEDLNQRARGRPRDEVARARILEAALKLVEDLGFANTTTDAIAEHAGASKATIYRWWPNKAAVLIEALREAVAQETPFPETGDLRQDLRMQLRNFVKLLTGRRGRIFKAFVAAAQSDPEVAESFRSLWIVPRRSAAIHVLERYQGRGIREDVDLDQLMDALYGPIYFRLLAGHRPMTEEFTDALVDMTLEGIEQR